MVAAGGYGDKQRIPLLSLFQQGVRYLVVSATQVVQLTRQLVTDYLGELIGDSAPE